MRNLKAKFDGCNSFYQYIDEFVIASEGIKILEKYNSFCNTRPRNIYKDTIDIRKRYEDESFVIYLCISYLRTLGFSKENIINEIQELSDFYPWINRVNLLDSMSFNTNIFINNIQYLINEFFSEVEQRTYGEFYSPIELIETTFNEIKLNKTNKVIDPSCGSGFFLYLYVDKLNRLGKLKSVNDIKILQDRMYGFDIFPFAIIMSKILVGYKISEIFDIQVGVFKFNNFKVQNTISLLSCKNSLTSQTSSFEFDLIIGNPPFFRIDPHDENEICSCISYGHNYAHSIFLHWSIQHLKQKGRLCLLLPQSMLSGFYYQKIREELLTICNIDLIIINSEDAFKVQQEIMILIASKIFKDSKSYIIGTIDHNAQINGKIKIPINLTDNEIKLIPTFKSRRELEVLRRLSKLHVVEYLKEVSFATGNYVWNQNKDKCYPDKVVGSIPLICGPNITEEGLNFNIERNGYGYCIPDKPRYIKTEKVILFRRMSPIGNEQRMISYIINPNNEGDEYVVENHVNIITCRDSERLEEIRTFITSTYFNILINSFCQTNQVSTNELSTIFRILIKMREINVR